MLRYLNPKANPLTGLGLRSLAALSALAMLVLLALYIEGTRTAGAQSASCETTDLGVLSAEADAELSTDAGRPMTATRASAPTAMPTPTASS